METTAKYKALSVTVPAAMERALSEVCRKEFRKKSEVVQEALRLYFRARNGAPISLALPRSDDDRKHTDLSAFAPEWSSSLDSAYDILGR
jgi:Arc/MetJ-type ribon-helix-helix transcriptional regulator